MVRLGGFLLRASFTRQKSEGIRGEASSVICLAAVPSDPLIVGLCFLRSVITIPLVIVLTGVILTCLCGLERVEHGSAIALTLEIRRRNIIVARAPRQKLCQWGRLQGCPCEWNLLGQERRRANATHGLFKLHRCLHFCVHDSNAKQGC